MHNVLHEAYVVGGDERDAFGFYTIVDGNVVLYFLHHQSETSKSLY